MPWLQVQMTVQRERAPLIELLLQHLGTLAVTQVDAADAPIYEPAPGTTPLWAATRVTGLFPAERDVDNLRASLHRGLGDQESIEFSVLEDRDWERAWWDRCESMRFGRRLWVCPKDHAVTWADAVVVSLNPGLAFGTGTHPTTALCLNWLDCTPLNGLTLVDFGCGSGILSIAAARLGAAQVIAVDHDPQAVTATRQNAHSNAVEDRVAVQLGSGDRIPSGDIVIANILANVLVEHHAQLVSAIGIGGKIALSGILEGQVDAVRNRFNHAVDFATPTLREGWALLVGERRR